ncbi:ABC transporter permease [Ciceribacter ferrooxidans]|nr:ABC transporter permease [Ciceribacter ferrooxidans]
MRLVLVLAALLVFAALTAPLISPYEPNAQSLLLRLKPPIGFMEARAGHLFGTDELGRDVLTRCLYGLQMTLLIAVSGAIIGMLIGGTLGLLAGAAGGTADALVMALVDIQIAVPFTLVALLAVAVFGSDMHVLIVVLGIAYWEQYARIIRGEVLKLREMPFIEASRAAGASPLRIAFRHIVPNVISPLVVMFTLNFSNIVLLESSLSFLGLGLSPPTATLGSMVGIGRDYMHTAPWIVAAPALLILLITLVVQMLGDRLRDRMDVRLRDR